MTRRGFTVIEALVGVAIAAILASTSAVVTSSLATALRLTASARTLAEAMRETRGRAMAEGVALDVRFDATAGVWTITAIDGTVRRAQPLPPSVRFLSLPARARIRFDSTGAAENGTVALGGGAAATCRIVVNQRGRVRLG
jgi:prepilin-type N-terminal cleavage/methylation domain-containing protein